MVTPKQLRKLFAAGYQLTPEAYSLMESINDTESVIEKILSSKFDKAILSVEDINGIINMKTEKESKTEVPAKKTSEKKKTTPKEPPKIPPTSEIAKEEKPVTTHIRKEKLSADFKIISTPKPSTSSASVDSFRQYFESRFELISRMFTRRRDIQNIVKTSSIKTSSSKDTQSLIAIVTSRQMTKTGHVILDL